MATIETDQLKAAHAAWVEAGQQWDSAAKALSNAQGRGEPREQVSALFELAQEANTAWHDRAKDLAHLVGRLLHEAERAPH